MSCGIWWCFGVYCALAASEWLLPPLPLEARGLVFAAVGVMAAVVHGRRRWNRQGEVGHLALAAMLAIGIPEAMTHWAVKHVAGAMTTAVLALVPAILVLTVAQQNAGVRCLLLPAVTGLGGILLLIPLSVAESLVGWIALALLVAAAILVAVGGVWIHRLTQNFHSLQALAVVCLASAAVMLGGGPLISGTGWRIDGAWGSVAANFVEVVLFVLLLRGMTPVRFGARFFLVPLLTVSEGVVLLRPEIRSRTVAGAGLLVAAVFFLLSSTDTDEETSLSFR